MLIDELCFSSVDDLAACLADLHPNVRFIGRPTNGGTGEPRVITRLRHSQTDVQFCLMVMRSPKGRLSKAGAPAHTCWWIGRGVT